MQESSDGIEESSFAVTNKNDEFLLEKIRRELHSCNPRGLKPRPINPREFSARQIRQLIAQNPFLQDDTLKEISESELKSDSNSWEAEPIINLVENLMEQALTKGVTDIHLEPNEDGLRIRFRKDGLLEDYRQQQAWFADPILIRLKILADIDITDRRIPHDGSFTYCGLYQTASVRVSTIPVQGGEKCVLRLLPQKQESSENRQGLAHLQLSQKQTDFLHTVFQSPQGLFLVTGPTGSGKTTTLHHGLQEIIQKKINVVTLEDPVEYTLQGANQVQINEKCGLTFASALRSILRQDPDVILVGEIRDAETAQIAIRAAQTGHLVVSTLHTNNARAAFTRLMDLGISKNLLQDVLLGVMAQRLIRQKSGGRRAVSEIIQPDGTFVDGSLLDSAHRLVQQGAVAPSEVQRVLGNLCYIKPHEDF